MATILRGISERYNPQIHTEATSLTQNMEKNPAVKSKAIDLWAGKNKFISWLYATGRTNMGANAKKVMRASQGISDNAYRIKYRGSLFIPAYAFGKCQIGSYYTADTDMSGLVGAVSYTSGITSGTVDINVQGSLAVKHDPANNIFGDKYNPGDAIVLGAYEGTTFIVSQPPVKASTGDHYIVHFKVGAKKELFQEAHLAADELLSEAGNRFGEGSETGYQRERRSKWRINYSFVSRVTLTMTGSAMSQQVAMLTNSVTKTSMWEFEQVMDARERHAVNMELGARYARLTMDPGSHSWFENYGTNKLTLDGFVGTMGIVAPVVGDGWIPQLDDSFSISYDPNADLNPALLEMFMTVLSQRSPAGVTGNTFVALGDRLSSIKVDKALKSLIGFTSDNTATIKGTTNVVYNVSTGQNNEVGFQVTTYHYLGNKIIFIEDDLMNNPAFAPQNGGILGTGTMYVMNASLVDGVSNIDLFSRSGRELRAKYIDGMHSLDPSRNNAATAASGFDGARFDILSEVLPIIYSTESCGVIRASAKFTGGAIAGQDVATEKATTWNF